MLPDWSNSKQTQVFGKIYAFVQKMAVKFKMCYIEKDVICGFVLKFWYLMSPMISLMCNTMLFTAEKQAERNRRRDRKKYLLSLLEVV